MSGPSPQLGTNLVAALCVVLAACTPQGSNPAAASDSGPADSELDSAGGTDGDARAPARLEANRLFPTDEHPGETFPNCLFTSPLRYRDEGRSWILVSRADGTIQALHPRTGRSAWSIELPDPEQGVKFLLADPARVGDHLVYVYHAIPENFGKFRGPTDRRLAHLAAVVDLSERSVDDDFPVVELQAEVPANESGKTVRFRPSQALTRPKLVHAREQGDRLGRVYAGQGNTRDIQPWHGWAWELDLDAWKNKGAKSAISGVFNTTPEPDDHCGTPGNSGSRQRKCGGGLWAPSGHLVVERGTSYRVVLAPGNGQLNLNERDYANTLLKMKPGLSFQPNCSDQACANFDPDAPSEACMESCDNVFIPRLMPGQEIPRPTDGRCSDRNTMFSCWEEMDYIGGSTPVLVETDEHEVLAYPTKDGHTYLVDWNHFGTMHDRHKMVELCGSNGGSCGKFWAGMSVTKPLKADIDGTPAVLVPTFMPDSTNPAGVVAMKVVETGEGPRLRRAWEYPDFESERAVQRFRRHPSRLAYGQQGSGGERLAWIVDTRRDRGFLTALDPQTGNAVIERRLAGRGRRYVVPLSMKRRVYVPSCTSNRGPGRLEGYRVDSASQ